MEPHPHIPFAPTLLVMCHNLFKLLIFLPWVAYVMLIFTNSNFSANKTNRKQDVPRFISTSFDDGPVPALFLALTLATYIFPLGSFRLLNSVLSVSFVVADFHDNPFGIYDMT